MKKLLALILCMVMVLSLVSCSLLRKGGDDTDADETTSEKQNPQNIEKETSFNFLVMGHDRAASLTDVIMIINFDTESGELTVSQLPRDTYVEVEDYYYHKINGLYNYYAESEAEKGTDSDSIRLEAVSDTAKHLEKALDITIHYYAIMDLDGFADIVDAIGGVYMYIPYSMYYPDPRQNLLINLPEGYRNMTGAEAEQFVRYRSGYLTADIGRGDAQKMFMTAFIESFQKNVNASTIDSVVASVLSSVQTNLSLMDTVSLAKAALKIDLKNVTMLTLPGEAAMCDGASYYVLNRASVIDVVSKYYNIYKSRVDDTTLDKERIFCNDEDSVMSEVYYRSADIFNYNEYNGQDISDNDIDIPLY